MNTITAVRRLLKGRGEDRTSTVIAAAEAGDVVELTRLLDMWPDLVDARGWMDATPLIVATWQADSFAAVQLLLGRGADPLATRVNGGNALHFATSGPIAELLAEAAGQQGLAARYLFESTPLHVAVKKNRRDVVAAFLTAGADPALTATRAADGNRVTPLDLTDNPEIALLLILADAPVQTPQPHTPLHRACALAGDLSWAEVAELLLERGADPVSRDEFGDTAIDLLSPDAPESLRARMIDILHTANRTLELGFHNVVVGTHHGLVIHPSLPEALSSMYSGAYLVHWQLAPDLEPVRIIKVPGRQKIRGPYGSTKGMRTAFLADESVLLRDWRDLDIVDVLPAELRPRRVQGHAAWSPDGRLLALTGGEELVVVDTEHGLRHDADDDEIMLGDWSITPQFSPDGRRLAVGNCMQGAAWLSLIDVSANGALSHRYEREDLPRTDHSNLVGSVVFSPDGHRFAAWIRPDHGQNRPYGYRGLVVVVDTATGDPVWHLRIDNDVAGVHGEMWWASLCFAAGGSWVAVGLDTGVLWLNAETGAPATQLTSIGAVHALASAAHTGVVAATERGVHRVPPPPR
ncbi:ankyrin repeat domain-containing protein [Nocardia sp. NPDC060259]|uniref:ankyrin repeat domain-containing protein n=1 Tax=Nocardia sp. NPDC060259 TaxID=3347088 RepID=UPI00364E88CA